MKISNKIVKTFQEGGPLMEDPAMAQEPGMAPEGMPAEEAPTEDPLMQLAELAGQALQGQDCQAAMAVCEGFMSLVQGGGEPAPAPAPEGAPVFKKGGKLARRI